MGNIKYMANDGYGFIYYHGLIECVLQNKEMLILS